MHHYRVKQKPKNISISTRDLSTAVSVESISSQGWVVGTDIDYCSRLVGLRSRPGCMADIDWTGHAAGLQMAVVGTIAVLRTAAGVVADVAAVQDTHCAGHSPGPRSCRFVVHIEVLLEVAVDTGSVPLDAVRIGREELTDGLAYASRTVTAVHSSAGLEDDTLRSEARSHPPGLRGVLADGAAVADQVAGCNLRFGRHIQGSACGSENESANGSLEVGRTLVGPDLDKFRQTMRSESSRMDFDRFHEACCVLPRNCQP